MNYKQAFFITLAILTILIIFAAIIFDRTIITFFGLEPPLIVKEIYLDPKYYKDKNTLPLAYDKHVTDVDSFYQWKKLLINDDLAIQNYKTIPKSISNTTHDGFVINKMLLGEIIVYKVIPTEQNGKTVFMIPGHGHAARDVLDIPTKHSVQYYHNGIGKKLAQLGYVVYTVDLDGYGERIVDNLPCADGKYVCGFYTWIRTLALHGISVNDIHSKEIAQVLSYINENHDKIAMSGISAGCKLIPTVLANPDIIDAVALAGCIIKIQDWPMFVTDDLGLVVTYNTMADPLDYASALAPKPLYISHGKQDTGRFLYALESGDIKRIMTQRYDFLGISDTFTFVEHEGGHEYDLESLVEFLDSAY